MSDEQKAKIAAARQGQRLSPEHREKISQSMKQSVVVENQHLNPEWRAKISQTMKGKPKSEETKRRMSEARTGRRVPDAWEGSAAEYSKLHRKVEKVRGKPQCCWICGATDPCFIYEWANLTGKYEDIQDYKRLCRSCHQKFDQARATK